MSELADQLAELDKLIHEPARLVILTALSAVQSADFLFLQNLTGLTPGNLSGHLTRLEEAGLIEITKKIVGKRPKTTLRLTTSGRQAIDEHWQRLNDLRQKTQDSASQQATDAQ
jgi:DNA-binding MarR family transcriptional regulator